MKKGTIQSGRELLSNKAVSYRDGFVENRGISVWWPVDERGTAIIGAQEHAVEDFVKLTSSLVSKVARNVEIVFA